MLPNIHRRLADWTEVLRVVVVYRPSRMLQRCVLQATWWGVGTIIVSMSAGWQGIGPTTSISMTGAGGQTNSEAGESGMIPQSHRGRVGRTGSWLGRNHHW